MNFSFNYTQNKSNNNVYLQCEMLKVTLQNNIQLYLWKMFYKILRFNIKLYLVMFVYFQS